MNHNFFNPSDMGDWINGMRLDFTSLPGFTHSLSDWVISAPLGVMVTLAAILLGALALTRRPGPAVLIVLLALGALGYFGFTQ
jgi:hypothetical protein